MRCGAAVKVFQGFAKAIVIKSAAKGNQRENLMSLSRKWQQGFLDRLAVLHQVSQ
jgi:hypothetical protein